MVRVIFLANLEKGSFFECFFLHAKKLDLREKQVVKQSSNVSHAPPRINQETCRSSFAVCVFFQELRVCDDIGHRYIYVHIERAESSNRLALQA